MTHFPARMLVDLPNWLGDFIHTVPAIRRLNEVNRGGQTHLLLPAAHVPLARLLGLEAIARHPKAGLRWARKHITGSFDIAITARHSTRAKLLLAGVDAPLRLASEGRGAGAFGLTTFCVDRSRHQRHDLDEALKLLGQIECGDERVRISLNHRLDSRGQQQRSVLSGGLPAIALLPATKHLEAKRYPPSAFAELARRLGEGGYFPLVVVGPGEESLGLEIALASGAAVAPTWWPLDMVSALLAACHAAVGSDSGLTHLAAAVGCPTVALFGPTEPSRTAPVGAVAIVKGPVSPRNGRKNLSELSPGVVLEAIDAAVLCFAEHTPPSAEIGEFNLDHSLRQAE